MDVSPSMFLNRGLTRLASGDVAHAPVNRACHAAAALRSALNR